MCRYKICRKWGRGAEQLAGWQHGVWDGADTHGMSWWTIWRLLPVMATRNARANVNVPWKCLLCPRSVCTCTSNANQQETTSNCQTHQCNVGSCHIIIKYSQQQFSAASAYTNCLVVGTCPVAIFQHGLAASEFEKWSKKAGKAGLRAWKIPMVLQKCEIAQNNSNSQKFIYLFILLN